MGSIWSNSSTTGRTAYVRSDESRNREELPDPDPNPNRYVTYNNTHDDPPSSPGEPPQPTGPDRPEVLKRPLKVRAVDLNLRSNTSKHNTDDYDIVDGFDNVDPHLVVRRGQEFDVTLTFDRNYNRETDDIHLIFEVGKNPKISKGTLVNLHLDGIRNKRKDQWESELLDSNGKSVRIAIQASVQCAIGKWYFEVRTSIKTSTPDSRKEIDRFLQNDPVYMLFNPWCRYDQVYMENTELLKEYVLNEKGRLFRGKQTKPWPQPWNFGQFESNNLDCCMYLLEKSGLNYQSCGDPVLVARAISKIVNSSDQDQGVLTGNWSGNYTGGVKPTAWVGSSKILEQYYETKKPVKFGQCWVFSGIVTTVARALGLPTRSITNYSSAHDTDDNTTIDLHWDSDDNPISRLNQDSVWNYHLWNECWMARPDLKPYDSPGWQAFDATPQEASDGVYQAGPACIEAIKNGEVNNRYDAHFIFAEVNADKVHWQGDEVIRIETDQVGKKISTKRPGTYDEREDITREYKYPEGSELERRAVRKANFISTGRNLPMRESTKDVDFNLDMNDNVMVGSGFNVTLKMQNTSREERNVNVHLAIFPSYYTGVLLDKKPIKTYHKIIRIPPIRTEEAVMRVTMEEYINYVKEQCTFEIDVGATVNETNQKHPLVETYKLRTPDLIMSAPASAKVGETIKVKVKLESPMPVTLTDCEWEIEGAHVTKPIFMKQNDVEPYGHVQIEVDITPSKRGHREIVASFTSNELQDVISAIPIEIIA